jgi:hypothetical protein
MKKVGIVILIVGLIFTVFTGLSFVTIDKVSAFEKLSISANNSHTLSWSPVIGSVTMVIGVAFYLIGVTKSQTLPGPTS